MRNIISNCCGAPIWQPDANGHGHCSDCWEPCTSENEDYMKETRTKRKEILLTPTEHAQISAAAKQAGLTLSAWLVMAANKWLEIEPMTTAEAIKYNKLAGDGTTAKR